MTALAPAPVLAEEAEPDQGTRAPAPRRTSRSDTAGVPLTGGRIASLVTVWVVVTLACILLVLYGLEPLFQQRTQHSLLAQYRVDISHSHYATEGLGGQVVASAAPDLGTAVGVLEIPKLHMRQVVVEGVAASQTADGPGHVPGTAGPGQPGNSAIVGRRSTYGGVFRSLGSLHKGDVILVTTTQGQTVYKVSSVGEKTVTTGAPASSSALGTPTGGSSGATANAQLNKSTDVVNAARRTQETSVSALYGPTKGDQLTLVTSARVLPMNGSHATVVVAAMQTKPFTPTPQNGRTSGQTGLTVDASVWPALLLAVQGFALSVVAAIVLYRRFGMRVAYLITTPPLIAFVILMAESVSRLLPAWT